VLVELGAVEQRYRAVLEVLEEGVSVTEVARRYGVARQTVHGWLRRYAEDGLGWLADRSPRPASCPHQIPAPVEARIVAMLREHPGWGPSRIRWELERAGVVPLPGRSAVYRALVRHGLVAARKRRRRREDYRRWERPRAMDLWQMDVMGRVYLAGGAEVKIVTGIDDHSRFVVCAEAVMRASGPNPLVARLAAEVVALRQPGTRDPGLHRFFQEATWLWAGIFLLLAAGLAVMMVTEPAKIFLMLWPAATVARVAAGTGASALWFFLVLRRLGLRLRFAPA